MHDCEYYLRNGKCYFGDNEIHVGTKMKLDIIEKYVSGWINKIFQAKHMDYSKVIFIDAMCSAGMYIDKKDHQEEIPGTSFRVLELFSRYANKYKDKNFYLYLNDINQDAINCQKCRLLTSQDNVFVEFYNKDVSEFMSELSEKTKDIQDAHFLLFYDPYNVDIRWEAIRTLISSFTIRNFKKYDLIITHFHQNDTSRAINTKINNPSTVKRYEESYDMSLNEIRKNTFNLGVIEAKSWFRSIFQLKMSDIIGDSQDKIAYYPIFNSSNNSIYDIVFYSPSFIGKQLFKSSVYGIVKDEIENTVEVSSLFHDEYLLKETFIFYNVNHYAGLICLNFSGRQNVSYPEIKSYIDRHPYIVEKMTLIYDQLINFYGVKSSEERSIKNKTFSFPIIEN